MRTLIKLEEGAIFALSLLLIARLELGFSWWLYGLIFLSPDLGMIGYLINSRVGAMTYNLVHHKALGAILILAGVIWQGELYIFAGLIQIGHSAFDRMLGFGLKYPDSFKHTNMGDM